MIRIITLLLTVTVLLSGGTTTAAVGTETTPRVFAPCVKRDSPVPTLKAANFPELKGVTAVYRISIPQRQLKLTSGKHIKELAIILAAVQQVVHLPCNRRITTLITYSDPTDTDGMKVAAEHRDDDIAVWSLAINLTNFSSEPGTIPRLVHEVGHVLFDYADAFGKNGCVKQLAEGKWGRFMQQFQKKHWDCQRSNRPVVSDRDFWHRFHLEHSAHDVGEDIANTFGIFVLCKKPSEEWETIAWQKIHHYWSYPELVDIRHKIRQSLGPAYVGKISYRGQDLCVPRPT